MENEIWVNIVLPINLNGKYQISSHGRLKRVAHYTKQGVWKPDLIRKIPACTRYLKFSTKYNGKSHSLSIHRLVCYAFHENPENKPQVNHKDNNKHNNHKDNLEWCTQPENIQHAQSIGVMPYAKPKPPKKKPGRAKGFKGVCKKVINIKTKEVFESVEILSPIIGLSIKNIRRQISGERYCHIPYRYLGKEDKVKIPPIVPEKVTPKIMFAKMRGNEVLEYVDYNQIDNLILKQKITSFTNGRCNSVNGFIYKKVSEDGSLIEPIPFISKKKIIIRTGVVPPARDIIKYSLDGIELKRYPSALYAAKEFNMDKRNFRSAFTKSPRGYFKGYIWKYA